MLEQMSISELLDQYESARRHNDQELLKFDKESGWWCFICIYCGDKTKVDKPTRGKPYHGNLKFRIVR